MFERQFTSNTTPPQPSSFLKQYYQLTSNSNFNLNTNIDEWFSFGAVVSQTTFNQRKNILIHQATLMTFLINLNSGLHDAEMTVTLDIDGSLTTRIITIPASGGAAILTETGSSPIAALSAFAYKIEGGGGTGNTAIMGYSQEVMM